MSVCPVYRCQCPSCREEIPHPDRELHRCVNLFLSRLDEQQRRWYVGIESLRVGHGGIRLLSQITGMDEKTIRRGRAELAAALEDRPVNRVRLPGGGRRPAEKKLDCWPAPEAGLNGK